MNGRGGRTARRRHGPMRAVLSACGALGQRWREDRGTVTILLIGVLVVILMVIAVTTSITGIHLDRNRLQYAADGAALAAAQAIDPDEVYGGGSGGVVDEDEARRRATDYLAADPATLSDLQDVTITTVQVGADGTVRITLEAGAHPLLVGWLTEASASPVPLIAVGEARSS